MHRPLLAMPAFIIAPNEVSVRGACVAGLTSCGVRRTSAALAQARAHLRRLGNSVVAVALRQGHAFVVRHRSPGLGAPVVRRGQFSPTRRSSGTPTAGRQGREAPWHILRLAALASCCRRPLSSTLGSTIEASYLSSLRSGYDPLVASAFVANGRHLPSLRCC